MKKQKVTVETAEALLKNGLVCPKCRSREIGFDVEKQKWDCHDCKHSWGE